MANLSSFFGDPSAGGGSSNQQMGILQMFGNGNGTYSIPAAAQYVAYGTIGAGGGSHGMNTTASSGVQGFGGAGGGFSYHEMDISGYSTAITACYTVGKGGCFGQCNCKATCSNGEPTCICGDACLTTICATGGQGGCKCLCICGGNGNGGMINNCGGGVFGINCNKPGGFSNLNCLICCNNAAKGGGGAGGFLGQGGCGGCTGGGGSGNGGGGGLQPTGRNEGQPNSGNQSPHGSRGVDQRRTGASFWQGEGFYMSCQRCNCCFHRDIFVENTAYHIPGTMLCNTTRYSIGKQIFGAASSSRMNQSCYQGSEYHSTQLPGAGGAGSTANGAGESPSNGGFMGGGGACGGQDILGRTGGCGGGGGGNMGCIHPNCLRGGTYSSDCCNTYQGRGGDGVAFIEYWLA